MKDVEYAGFWIRVGASLIDIILSYIVLSLPLSLIFDDSRDINITGFNDSWGINITAINFWNLLGNVDYWDLLSNLIPAVLIIWFWLRYSATPGKMATGLTVVDARTGKKITTLQGIIRYLSYFISTIPLGLGLIWVGIDRRKQGWHDKLAGTVVLRKNLKEPVKFEDQT